MRNKLWDLNNLLFAQLERLDDEEMPLEALQAEIERSKAISQISGQIIQNANIQLKAAELVAEYGPNNKFNLGSLIEAGDDE